jgi:hypothetical protein
MTSTNPEQRNGMPHAPLPAVVRFCDEYVIAELSGGFINKEVIRPK